MRRTHPLGEYGTIRQTARRSGFGERAVREAVRRGELALYTVAGSWPRIRWSDFEAWAAAHAVRPSSRAEAIVGRILEREDRRAG
jgi:hypothetical protein